MREYKGNNPEKVNVKTCDFYNKGIILTQYGRTFKSKYTEAWARFIFKSEGLMGIIRRDCYNKNWCVDVQNSWWNGDTCLTTKCKTIQEAKDILYQWFKEQNFKKIHSDYYDKITLSLNNHQIRFNPIIFR